MGSAHYFVFRRGGGRIFATSLHFTRKSAMFTLSQQEIAHTPAQYKLTVLLAQKCIHNACQTPNVKSVNSVNSDQLRQLGQQRQRSELGQKRQLLQLGQQLVSRSQTLRESGCVTLVNSYNSVNSDNSVNSVSSDNDNSFNSVNSDALLSTHYIGQLGGHFLK